MQKQAHFWAGTKPVQCDICFRPFKKSFANCRTVYGRWGLLCLSCISYKGTNLGQVYTLNNATKQWDYEREVFEK